MIGFGTDDDWEDGEIAQYVKYLAICKYPNEKNEFYLFYCSAQYEVVADSLWDSIASCMDEAKSFYGNQITWIENDSSEGYLK